MVCMTQNSLFPSDFLSNSELRQKSREYDSFTRTRLSTNFILRDFLYSSDSDFRGIRNVPDDFEMTIRAGKALCEKILEPTLAKWGRFFITFAYQSRVGIQADWSLKKKNENFRSSSPHQWDRFTFGSNIYARVDILPICVEDGLVSKYDYGRWMMHELDVDLLMMFKRSNAFCITYSEFRPRRVWLEWGNPAQGQPKVETFMGKDYWENVWPKLPENERPKFGPSSTGGSMQWGKS